MTYEANTASTVTKVANEAVQNIIKIINNCTKKDTTGDGDYKGRCLSRAQATRP